MVSPWVGKGFAPILLDTVFYRERSHPKGNFPGRAAHKQDTGAGGTQNVAELLHPDICLRVEMLNPGEISSGDLPLFPTAREEAENTQKGGGLSFSGLQRCAPPCQGILGCHRFTRVPQDWMKPSTACYGRGKAPEVQETSSVAFQFGSHLLRTPVLPKSIPKSSTSRRSARNCVSCLRPP